MKTLALQRSLLLSLIALFSTVAAQADTALPHARLMPLEQSKLQESAWILSGDHPAIYALGDEAHPWDEHKEPLILVHGFKPNPGQLTELTRRFQDSSRYQLYFFAYDSYHRRTSLNGDDLARELLAFPAFQNRPITLIAHSMGGLIARRALNSLTAGGATGRFASIRLYTADTPWHGFGGPADHGSQLDLVNRVGAAFLPAGLMDMRAGSWMFRAPGVGLNVYPVAPNVSIHIAFSKDGTVADDYRKGGLRSLAWETARWISGEAGEPTGSFRLQNFWAALKHSAEFPAFEARLRELHESGRLDTDSTLDSYAEFYPEYPGDHSSMLLEHPGEYSYLEALSDALSAQ